MGCGSSTALPVAPAPAADALPPKDDKQQEVAPHTAKDEAKATDAHAAAATDASSTAAKAEGQAHEATSVAERYKQKVLASSTGTKLTVVKRIDIAHPLQDVWPVISDWNLGYLTVYFSKIKVVVEPVPDTEGKLISRHVTLPTGEFQEVLLSLDNEQHRLEYIAERSPLPFYNHVVSLRLSAAEGSAGCVLDWDSFAWVKPGESPETTQSAMEAGVLNAVQVVNHALATRRPE